MKQKQANVVEAHLTREQTEVAADQSRSVMIFTIFTIIFLPLSFFASVFGINAREWSGTETNLPLSSIFIYMGTISLGLIIVALLAAFNRFTRRVMQYLWKVIAKPFVVWFHYVLARVAPLEDERVDTRQAARETRMPSIASALGAETDDFEVINTTHDIV